ncbi:hypothetical protein Hamer_G000483 [Homarus americanus]|uniref:Uncharacterized protein n=1 Tax=Homarus americanus TaxID=6706 RepID=A0A8J5NCR4_HOMAM|nr:hypothetical protein Hamer_G000483 [Homarus americanus]
MPDDNRYKVAVKPGVEDVASEPDSLIPLVQELVWHEIQRCVIEGGIGIVDDLPKTPRVPVWLPNLGTNIALSDDIGPKYLAEETASTEITKVLISQGVDELMCSHRGITMGVALVVDAVYTLIRTHKTPFLLLLGPSSTDKDKVTSDTEGEMLDLLGVIGDKSGDDGSLSSQTIMTHVPATLLQFPDVLRVVLDMASVEDVAYKRLCVVTGSKEEVWPLCQELKPAARHGQVICLPIFKTLQHEVFVQSLLKKNKFLQNEACGTLTEIADFITYVHESYCADEALTNANVAVNQLTYSSLKQLPAVTSLAKSRSPISAIQIVFECAVVLLGSSDTSWRAVRHAIQDDNFCSKLAAVCVPGLKQSVIATLTEKLELQVEMATRERMVRMAREDVANLKSQLEVEEKRMSSLKKKKITIEEELESILDIINELNPHSERLV